jgi:hypothetical protein
LGGSAGIAAGNTCFLENGIFLVQSAYSVLLGKMMKKRLISFVALFPVFLAACGSLDAATAIDETPSPLPTFAPPQSVAECTAQSAEPVDYAQPGDWITGATEGYAITMVEYGDFQ